MDYLIIIEGLINASTKIFQWQNMILFMLAVMLGLLIGILPGIGGGVGLALLIPLTFDLGAETAVMVLICLYMVSGFGGLMTSILFNVPGEASNAATTLDGYPLTQQGRSKEAIGSGILSSLLAGLVGFLILIFLIPLSQKVILQFSYPEFFMLALFGLITIAALTQGETLKGLIAAGVGIMLSFIGSDPLLGLPRFTFDQLYLWGGINVVCALIGIFAGAEVLELYSKKTTITSKTVITSKTGMIAGFLATLQHWRLVVRSTIVGVIVGIIPGVGGSVSSFIAYGQAVQTSKHPEKFGKGAIEGVISAEAANNAKEGGALLPTIAFGIPGSAGMAILLGALTMHGIPAGPNIMLNHTNIVYMLISTSIVATIIAAAVSIPLGAHISWLTKARGELIAPIIAIIALLGSYALNQSMADVLVTIIFAFLGYMMKQHNFSRSALVIGLFLGGLIETTFHQSLLAHGFSGFITRPISLVIFLLILFVLFGLPMISRFRNRKVKSVGGE